jgi:hypothetical protein
MQEANDPREITRKLEDLINGLTFDELVIVNRMSANRIRLMHKAGALYHMAQFNVGDTVYWKGNDGTHRSGEIIRLNQKTISIKTKEQGQWNVSPQLLSK